MHRGQSRSLRHQGCHKLEALEVGNESRLEVCLSAELRWFESDLREYLMFLKNSGSMSLTQ